MHAVVGAVGETAHDLPMLWTVVGVREVGECAPQQGLGRGAQQGGERRVDGIETSVRVEDRHADG
ncbi:hypothetical protein GCM10025876_04260 [Demequina litorisediminis]|uniref:Uncharacterized protein n=1 Tax=Demequina litorisediminis TaxID=1849022 RepID=A0ABQ6IB63_9MICO|nr:hypothetical protein GCM10025876_04260 [Demequina litorisediminis]